MIGIFWVYREQVFGLQRVLSAGAEGIPGLIDCEDNHAEAWDSPNLLVKAAGLGGFEYQDVPRGRVLYDQRAKRSLVYMDRVLMTSRSKQLITEYFSLDALKVVWRHDAHYSTTTEALDRLLR